MTNQNKPKKYPDYSETTFAFCLTYQIYRAMERERLECFPDFLSTSVEGKEGGGYDVKVGNSIFLQFKRSKKFDINTCKDAALVRSLKDQGILSLKFKFQLREHQHKLLLEHCETEHHVYYAAPLFLEAAELQANFLNENASELIKNTAFIRPQPTGNWDKGDSDEIRKVIENPKEPNPIGVESHKMLFAHEQAYICSEPVKVKKFLTGDQLLRLVKESEIDDVGKYLNNLFNRIKKADGDEFQKFAQFVPEDESLHPDLRKYLQLHAYFKVKYEMEFFLFVLSTIEGKHRQIKKSDAGLVDLFQRKLYS